MSTSLQNALHELTNPQIDFICNEFSTSREELFAMTDDAIGDLYDRICDIEVDEIHSDGSVSNRGKIAADVVTVIGNAIAEALGFLDEDEEDDSE